MSRRRTGGLLIIAGVVLVLISSLAAAFGGADLIAVGGPGYLLVGVCLGLLGAGVALLSIDRPIFGGTLARRGLKTLAIGLLGGSVTISLMALPGFEGWKVMTLFVPFFVFAWATIIGAGMTVLALIAAGGRPRIVGVMSLVVVLGLFVANAAR